MDTPGFKTVITTTVVTLMEEMKTSQTNDHSLFKTQVQYLDTLCKFYNAVNTQISTEQQWSAYQDAKQARENADNKTKEMLQ